MENWIVFSFYRHKQRKRTAKETKLTLFFNSFALSLRLKDIDKISHWDTFVPIKIAGIILSGKTDRKLNYRTIVQPQQIWCFQNKYRYQLSIKRYVLVVQISILVTKFWIFKYCTKVYLLWVFKSTTFTKEANIVLFTPHTTAALHYSLSSWSGNYVFLLNLQLIKTELSINQLLIKITLSQSSYVIRKYIKTKQRAFKERKKKKILASLLHIRQKAERNTFLQSRKPTHHFNQQRYIDSPQQIHL